MQKDIFDKIKIINKLLKQRFGLPHKAKELPKPIDMLIATILSQNTNDQNSYKAYQNLRKKYPDWDDANKARRTTIEKEIKIAGLGFQKSTAIKNLLNELKSKIGNFELEELNKLNDLESIEYLSSFKGIGVKTASCVLLFALGKNICPVDTHVHRTLNRIGIVDTKTPDKTFFQINQKFPPKIAHSFHTNLIRLGREICTPSGFTCSSCPVEKVCNFKDKNYEAKARSNARPFMLLDNV
jgi:endonuclease-3